MDIEEAVKTYIQCEQAVEAMESVLAEAKQALTSAERTVVEAFEDNPNVTAIEYAGRKWSIDDAITVRPVSEYSQQVVNWIKDHGGADLVQPSMHWKRRDSFLRDTLIDDDGKPCIPNELIGLVEVNSFPRLNKRKVQG